VVPGPEGPGLGGGGMASWFGLGPAKAPAASAAAPKLEPEDTEELARILAGLRTPEEGLVPDQNADADRKPREVSLGSDEFASEAEGGCA